MDLIWFSDVFAFKRACLDGRTTVMPTTTSTMMMMINGSVINDTYRDPPPTEVDDASFP